MSQCREQLCYREPRVCVCMVRVPWAGVHPRLPSFSKGTSVQDPRVPAMYSSSLLSSRGQPPVLWPSQAVLGAPSGHSHSFCNALQAHQCWPSLSGCTHCHLEHSGDFLGDFLKGLFDGNIGSPGSLVLPHQSRKDPPALPLTPVSSDVASHGVRSPPQDFFCLTSALSSQVQVSQGLACCTEAPALFPS